MVKNGKMDEEKAEDVKAKIEKSFPDFVVAKIIAKQDDSQ